MGGGGRIKRGATPLYAALTRTLIESTLIDKELSDVTSATASTSAGDPSLVPSPSTHLSMLHAEKGEGLVGEIT